MQTNQLNFDLHQNKVCHVTPAFIDQVVTRLSPAHKSAFAKPTVRSEPTGMNFLLTACINSLKRSIFFEAKLAIPQKRTFLLYVFLHQIVKNAALTLKMPFAKTIRALIKCV